MDASWAYALNLAHAHHLVFGKEVAFTFGPLGYLFYPAPDLAAPLPAFGLIWAVYALLLFGLFLIWRALGNHFITLVSWVVLSGAMLLTDLPFERLQLSFTAAAVGIVALIVVQVDAPSIDLVIMGVTAGLTLLLKANEGIASWVIYYTLLTLLVVVGSEKKRAWQKAWTLAPVPPLAFVLGFAVVERNISGLLGFAARSMHIVAGYSEAMAFAGPSYQTILAIFGLVTLCVVVPLLAEHRRDLAKGLLPTVLVGFFAFKNLMVRQDTGHADLLHVKLAVAALFLLICARTARDRLLMIAYVAGSFVLGASVLTDAFPNQGALAARRALLRDVAENLSANWHYSTTWRGVAEQTRENLRAMRLDTEICSMVGGGTVDDVPHEIDIVAANGWRWSPRPIFQSYSAYTPELDELNARHLASRESADHIIMQWEAIDGRNPLLDDAASWRALFDHYDVELVRSSLLVLKRRDGPRYVAPSAIGSTTGAWNTDIVFPQLNPADLLMMRVDIDKAILGTIRGILFRNSSIYLTATHRSGRQSRWRVTRANLKGGAFVGELPQTLSEALPYFGRLGDSPPDGVVSIRFETSGQAEFSSTFRISWSSVAFRPGEPRPDSLPLIAPASPTSGAFSNLLNVAPSAILGYVDQVDGRPHDAGSVSVSSNRPIGISGWAVDAPAHETASAVYVDVGGRLFPASYGTERPDVAAALKEPAYLRSGFSVQVPLSSFAAGTYKVVVRVVNAKRYGYYAGPSFQLEVK